MSLPSVQIDSPIGELEWVIIDGEGKPDLNGNPKYQADVVVSAEVGEAFIERVMEFWEENKPKGAKAPKSIGVYDHTVKDEDASREAGENVYVPTGNKVIRFKTNPFYASGDPKIVKVFNSKGNEVSLMGKKIGNGSRGRINGVMGIYDNSTAARGVTFYLNGIQLSKFVPYTGGVSFSEMEDEEGDGFEGVEGAMGGIEDEQDSTPAEPKVRL